MWLIIIALMGGTVAIESLWYDAPDQCFRSAKQLESIKDSRFHMRAICVGDL